MTEPNSHFVPAPIPTEEQLATFDHRAIASPVELVGDVLSHVPNAAPLAALSPAMRDRITEKLADVTPGNRDLFEQSFIREELEANSYRLKVMAGPGAGANPYERECFGIMRELYDIDCEIERHRADIEAVVDYKSEVDAEGIVQSVPIYRFSAATRHGREEAIRDLTHRRNVLENIEAPRRRKDAAVATANLIAEQNDQMAILSDAKAKAEELIRQEKVDALAHAFAKNRRSQMN